MLADLIGRTIQAKVTDENDRFVFAQADGETFRLAKDELRSVPRMGALITGFAYENADHQLQLTKTAPKSGIDRYAWGTVVASRHDLGVFVDVGLPNKDVVVSLDDLPTVSRLWPRQGDRLLVALRVDAKARMSAVLANADQIRQVSVLGNQRMMNHNVTVTVYQPKLVGSYVLTQDYVRGFIHPSEWDEEPRLGATMQARVIGVRPDGILNLSVKPRAYEAIAPDAAMLKAALEHTPGHTLPYSDKSSPAAIRSYFGISKGQFKRALGHLLKTGIVEQDNGQIRLRAPFDD